MNLFKELCHFFLFSGLDENSIKCLIGKNEPTSVSFSRGETIYNPASYEKKVGFIISGECEVLRPTSSANHVLINILSKHDSFGILAAFSDNEFPTEIRAAKKCEVVFFSDKDIRYFVENNSHAAMNLVKFLTKRIEFLNERINAFSAVTVEQKLSSLLLCEAKREGDEFVFNRKRAAEEISVGRASLYRGLESLKERGFITYDSKKIYIIDRIGLERISK